MLSLDEFVGSVNPATTSLSAWATFEPTVRGWIVEAAPLVVLEVGGGRSPMLDASEASALRIQRYLVNDVSEAELARLPEAFDRAHFDIQVGPAAGADYENDCDLIFAHMVFEHLADPAGAWATVHRLLRPGGTAISFHPVLWSPPFVLNKLMPERLTRPLLRRFFSRRNDDDHPKFPAYYRWCRASTRYMSERLEPIGFSSVSVIPFYGHEYFARVPGLRSVDRWVGKAAQRRDWTGLASYAYVIAVK